MPKIVCSTPPNWFLFTPTVNNFNQLLVNRLWISKLSRLLRSKLSKLMTENFRFLPTSSNAINITHPCVVRKLCQKPFIQPKNEHKMHIILGYKVGDTWYCANMNQKKMLSTQNPTQTQRYKPISSLSMSASKTCAIQGKVASSMGSMDFDLT